MLPRNWEKLVQTWLDEDIPGFDIGGYVVGSKEETAILYGKTDGVLAGKPFFDRVFTLLGCKVCVCLWIAGFLIGYLRSVYAPRWVTILKLRRAISCRLLVDTRCYSKVHARLLCELNHIQLSVVNVTSPPSRLLALIPECGILIFPVVAMLRRAGALGIAAISATVFGGGASLIVLLKPD